MPPRVVSKEFVDTEDDASPSDIDELDDSSDEVSSIGSTPSRKASPPPQEEDDSDGPVGYADRMIDHILLEGGSKRKRKGSGGKTKAGGAGSRRKAVSKTNEKRAADPASAGENEAKKCTYNLSLFDVKEKGKDLKKRTGEHTYMKLSVNEPFDTWKAQILVRIEESLAPDALNIDEYDIRFTVARVSPSPMKITSEQDYADMLERVSRTKDYACQIYVQALNEKGKSKGKSNNNKENTAGDEAQGATEDEDGRPKKKAKKTKMPKASDIDTANIPHNNNIKMLRERWICHKKPGCSSEHCFINPQDSTHFVLGHAHFDTWAASMMKGPEYATAEKPPNHHLFTALSNNHLGQLSPLLERRNKARNANEAAAGPSVMQLSLSPEIVQFFRPQPPPLAAPEHPPPAVPPALAPAAVIHPEQASLIAADRLPGPDMSLEDFCIAFRLTDGVRQKLDENGYAGTHTFQYVDWEDLRDAGLKKGEIAQLKHALSMWSVPQNAVA